MNERALEGRTALVAGASSGVGAATARAFSAAGAEVLAVARREWLLRELAAEQDGIRVAALDLTDVESVRALPAELERLDLLVCAAGTNVRRRGLDELSTGDWQRVLEVNATAAFLVVQTCLPLLRASGGLVIMLGSVSSRWPDRSGVAYQTAKRALLGFAHAVALEEHGVRVSAILPGVIDTPFLDSRPVPPPPGERAEALRAEDVAEICLFLATLDARVTVPELVVLPTALQRIGRT